MHRRKIDRALYRWRGSKGHGPLVIGGARRVGKTSSVRELGNLYEHFVELNLERYPNHRAALADSPGPETLVNRIRDEYGRDSVVMGKTLILLDEVLACPGAWRTVEKFVGFGDCDLIAVTSLPGYVRDRVTEGMSYLEMGPYDFEEFLWARGVSEAVVANCVWRVRHLREFDEDLYGRLDRQIRDYISVGGLPDAVEEFNATHSVEAVRRRHGELVNVVRGATGIYAESRLRGRVFECIESLPGQIASGAGRFYYSKIDSDGRTSAYGAREYGPAVKWLVDAGVCLRCDVTDDPARPGSGDLFKLYISDTGILMSMLPRAVLRDIQDPSVPLSGTPAAENMIACMVHRFGNGIQRYRRRSTEIDFLTMHDNLQIGLDARSGNNPKSKALESLISSGRIDRAVRFGDGQIRIEPNGVERYPVFAAGFMDSVLGPTHTLEAGPGGGIHGVLGTGRGNHDA